MEVKLQYTVKVIKHKIMVGFLGVLNVNDCYLLILMILVFANVIIFNFVECVKNDFSLFLKQKIFKIFISKVEGKLLLYILFILMSLST